MNETDVLLRVLVCLAVGGELVIFAIRKGWLK